nr:hypothetical protein [Tanacetum cinerariifolium]
GRGRGFRIGVKVLGVEVLKVHILEEMDLVQMELVCNQLKRQWDTDHDYFNPKNIIVSEDEMDVDAMNKTPASNNLNVNTQESIVIHMGKDLVEVDVADPFIEYEIINKSVVAKDGVVVLSLSKKSIGKRR